jgi:hypothetical protein
MPLKLRPSGLGSGIDKGRQDYETREGPEKHLRWFRSFAVQGSMTRADRVATFEEAKVQFLKSCDAWKHGRSWKRCPELRQYRMARIC